METILLINDDLVQLELYSLWLDHAGYLVRRFYNSEEALKSLHGEDFPDLVITDLYMPGIDGWRVCRLLRSPEYHRCNDIPILVTSATFAGTEAEEITRELGADAFLPVPVKAPTFISAVTRLMEGETAARKPKVLIVEDSTTLLELLKNSFSAHGFVVYTAADGKSALKEYKETCPDVAVLDYYLPDFRGDELLVKFKAENPRAVLIMMTTDPDMHLAVDWMKKGAWAYVRKPFDFEYLMHLCSQALREKQMLNMEEMLEQRTQELLGANQDLEKLLNEKEILLKEIHHRVKNNLNIVASLLNLQSFNITDEDTIRHFKAAEARIESMSLIHEKIYQSDSLAAVDLKDYIEDISVQLADTYCSADTVVDLDISVGSTTISLDNAVPLGLILNELITNSLRHGCSVGKSRVSISFHTEHDHYVLTVRDTGRGMPEQPVDDGRSSLGLILVNSLADQIGGTFETHNDNGAVAVVKFAL